MLYKNAFYYENTNHHRYISTTLVNVTCDSPFLKVGHSDRSCRIFKDSVFTL